MYFALADAENASASSAHSPQIFYYSTFVYWTIITQDNEITGSGLTLRGRAENGGGGGGAKNGPLMYTLLKWRCNFGNAK